MNGCWSLLRFKEWNTLCIARGHCSTVYISFILIHCSLVLQVENFYEANQHVPVGQHEKNFSIIEAYTDPRLQPVVVMNRLADTWYFAEV